MSRELPSIWARWKRSEQTFRPLVGSKELIREEDAANGELVVIDGSLCYRSVMIVVTNRIPVAEGYEIDFEDRFRNRVHLVDQAPGFVRNEVHRPKPMKLDHQTGEWSEDTEEQGYYEVKTWWRSFEDFKNWTNSPAFAEAHKNRPPKGMFRGPNKLEIHEVFLSTDDKA